MKKFMLILTLLAMISLAHAKAPQKWQRPMLEIAPKATLYIGSVRFGLGADVVFNPFKNLSFRTGVIEMNFGEGGSFFTLNRGQFYQIGSVEVLYYLSMPNMHPYVDAGFSLGVDGGTAFAIGGGMGLDFVMDKRMTFFAEPSIIISDLGEGTETDFVFRFSAGIKLGLIK